MAELTVDNLRRIAHHRLASAGILSWTAEGEMIVGHVLGLRRTELYRRAERTVTEEQASAVRALVERRCLRIPLQYLLGECEFMSLTFKVHEGVFIPRPETEVLVRAVTQEVEASGIRVGRILDVGTGCGVVGISLARYLSPDLAVCTDISGEAVEIAQANAILTGVETVTRFVTGDRLEFVRDSSVEGFDVVACNPPYVETGEIAGLEPEVRDHEPRLALDGGADGLRFIDGIIPVVTSILTGGGMAAFEIGASQGPSVKALFEKAGLERVEIVKDLAGLDRVAVGRRS